MTCIIKQLFSIRVNEFGMIIDDNDSSVQKNHSKYGIEFEWIAKDRDLHS
jgi:hypothetical protein